MEQIAPLAKILAEANGLDWKSLRGTGAGGTIVEQDVIDHLTRIMSGEEEPPSTPVDAPPPEWNGTELPAGGGLLAPGMPSMDMLSSAGVDSDLAALVGQPAPSAPAVGQPPMPPAASTPDDDLEFELEDEQEQPAVAAQPVPMPPAQPVMPSFTARVEETPVQTPEVVPAVPEVPRSEPVTPPPSAAPVMPSLGAAPAPAASAQTPSVPTPPPAAPPAQGGMKAGLGSLLSRLYQPGSGQAGTPPAAQTPAAQTPAQPPVAPMPEPQVPAAQATAATPAPLIPPLPTMPAVSEVMPPAPTLSDAPRSVEAEEEAIPLAPAAEAMPAAPTVEEAPVPAGPMAEPVPAPVAAPMPVPAAPVRDAVWFGTYLRRDANVSALSDLRRQLVSALGQDVSLGLLVARAAQRHADSLGLGVVAVQDLNASVARPVEGGTLRAALTAFGGEQQGAPDLLVIDAGTLDLDDLHLPHTVTLSVGRVQDGRAALTLNGNVDAAQGARFLASVAATLEEPIILVL